MLQCSVIRTDLGQVSMSPNLIHETGHVPRFVSDILCYLDYLKSVFIQNKCVFNKYKSYIIFLYYIILYFIVLILFYFIFYFILSFYFINIILYCYIYYFYIYIKNAFIKCIFIQNKFEIPFSIQYIFNCCYACVTCFNRTT